MLEYEEPNLFTNVFWLNKEVTPKQLEKEKAKMSPKEESLKNLPVHLWSGPSV